MSFFFLEERSTMISFTDDNCTNVGDCYDKSYYSILTRLSYLKRAIERVPKVYNCNDLCHNPYSVIPMHCHTPYSMTPHPLS